MASQSATDQALLNPQMDENPEYAAFADDESDLEEHGTTKQGAGITHTQAFRTVVGIVIGLNTVLIVIEASMINNMSVKPFLGKLELMFTIIYVLELNLKLKEMGFKDFFRGRGYKWNIFDLVITIVGVADAAVTAAAHHSSTGAEAARLFRMMRLMRLIKAMRFLQDMDTVLKVAGEATIQFFFVVLVVVFVAGIVTTNMLWDAPNDEVKEKFAYLGQSMWTMYCLMTMDNWVMQVTQIAEVRPGMIVFFAVYIFIAAITLMSLTPAIFVQLNMYRKEQEAEEKVREQKRLFIKQHAAMMEELFNTIDTDHNNKVSMNEMRRVIKDKKSKLLKGTRDKQFKEEGMLRNLMLSIFDFWDESSFEYAAQNHEFSKEEFTEHIIDRLANPNAELLFCGVATRKMAYDLLEQVMTEIGKLQNSFDWAFGREIAQLRRAVEANGGQLSPGAQCEGKVARASLHVARSLSQETPRQPAKIASSYSRQEIYPPPRDKEKEQESIMRTTSAFVDALALASLQVPLMHDVGNSMGPTRALDNPGEQIRGLASQEPLAAAGPTAAAAAAPTASFRWQEQQNQQKQPTLDSEKANEDSIRLMKSRSSNGHSLPAAMSSTTASTPSPSPTPGSDRPLPKFLGRRRDHGLDSGYLAHVPAHSSSPRSDNISPAKLGTGDATLPSGAVDGHGVHTLNPAASHVQGERME